MAIKVFDIVCIAQNKQNNADPSKTTEANLKLLAGQCLLLASKFVEIGRLYPAEIVYQVKSWGHNEYEVLKAGQVEEYILNTIDFDVMFLTPQEFLEMYCDLLNHGLPAKDCLRAAFKNKADRELVYALRARAKLYAMSLCNDILVHMGHLSNVKYLPSQVAAAALHLAWKVVIQEQSNSLGLNLMQSSKATISKAHVLLKETFKVFGHDISQKGGLNSLYHEIIQNK